MAIRVPLQGFTALRWAVIAAFVLAWNALNALAIYLNGGWGRYTDSRSFVVLALTCGATSALSFAIALSPRIRNMVTAPSRREKYEPSAFVLLGCVAALLACAAAFELYSRRL